MNAMMLSRILALEEAGEERIFLWGARQAGKSTLLRTLLSSDTKGLRAFGEEHPEARLVVVSVERRLWDNKFL